MIFEVPRGSKGHVNNVWLNNGKLFRCLHRPVREPQHSLSGKINKSVSVRKRFCFCIYTLLYFQFGLLQTTSQRVVQNKSGGRFVINLPPLDEVILNRLLY